MTRLPPGWLTRAFALGFNLFAVACFFSVCSAFSLTSQSDSAETHEQVGLQFAHAGNLPLAEDELRKAVAMAPENAGFLQELGTVLAMEMKLEESTSFFERALRMDPRALTARRYLAASLWQLHRFAEARQNLQT